MTHEELKMKEEVEDMLAVAIIEPHGARPPEGRPKNRVLY